MRTSVRNAETGVNSRISATATARPRASRGAKAGLFNWRVILDLGKTGQEMEKTKLPFYKIFYNLTFSELLNLKKVDLNSLHCTGHFLGSFKIYFSGVVLLSDILFYYTGFALLKF